MAFRKPWHGMSKMRAYLKNKSASAAQQFDSLVGQRGRLVLKTGTWSLLAKICAAINLFACVPFVLNSLGESHFGAWATIVSIVTLSNFLDFGLGNGAMNLIAGAKGRAAETEIAQIIRASYRSVIKITLLLSLSLFVVPFIPWFKILGLSISDAGVSSTSIAIVLFAVLLTIPLSIANKIQLGLGHGNKTFRWQALGQLLTAIVVIILAKQGATLPMLVAASTLTPLLALLLNTIELNRVIGPNKAEGAINPAISKSIQKEGLLFFVLQLSAALAFNFDLVLISSLIGAEQAGEYSVVQRVFSIIPMSLGLIWVSLWPTYREALAKADYPWVFKIFKKSAIVAVVYSASIAIVLALSIEFITKIWLGRSLDIPASLIWGFVIWQIIDSLGTSIAMLLNAASIMKYQLIVGFSFAVICFSLKITTLSYFGTHVLPWTTVFCYLLLNLLPTYIYLPKLIKNIHSTNY